jgi:23S rRNA (adenine2503-C2)-methyltransferase
MGMGEPFHNEEQVHAAIEVLCDPRAGEFSPRRIVISTVGIPEAMVRTARRWPQIHLALSLHSARPEVRRRLMPISERHDLASLRAALVEIADPDAIIAAPQSTYTRSLVAAMPKLHPGGGR